MGFCKYCGKELDSEGRCTCAEFEEENTVQKEKIKADELTDGKAKKILIGIGIGILVATIIALVIWIIASANAYKKPVNKLVKGIKWHNSETLIEAMYTEDDVAELKVRVKNSGKSWEDFIKESNKAIKENSELEGRKRLKGDIVAKEKLSGSNLDNISNFYEKQFEADVKKAYRVEVKFTLKENGEKRECDGWLCVVKLKDGGWKYCPEYSPDKFDFIDDVINIINK